MPHPNDSRPAEEPTRPDVRAESDHAHRAADALLAMVISRDPEFSVNNEIHGAAVALIHALAAALARK